MIPADDLVPGDVMCVGGQIGTFVSLRDSGKKKAVCFRPFGCDSTRLGYPGIVYRDEARNVRVERNEQWVRVTK